MEKTMAQSTSINGNGHEADLAPAQIDFSGLLENLPFLFAYVDSEERYRYRNRISEQWWRRSSSEFYGKRMVEVLGEDFYRKLKPWVDKALSGQRVNFETSFPWPEGTDHIALVTYVPDKDKDGKVKGFFIRAEDITERRLFEQEL